MDEMADIILNGKKPILPVDGEEGWKDMKIVDAIYKAVKTGEKGNDLISTRTDVLAFSVVYFLAI